MNHIQLSSLNSLSSCDKKAKFRATNIFSWINRINFTETIISPHMIPMLSHKDGWNGDVTIFFTELADGCLKNTLILEKN